MEGNAVNMYSVFLCESFLGDEPFVNDAESTSARFVSLSELDSLYVEPDSRWFVETYLNLHLEPLVPMANSFTHPYLQIFSAFR